MDTPTKHFRKVADAEGIPATYEAESAYTFRFDEALRGMTAEEAHRVAVERVRARVASGALVGVSGAGDGAP